MKKLNKPLQNLQGVQPIPKLKGLHPELVYPYQNAEVEKEGFQLDRDCTTSHVG